MDSITVQRLTEEQKKAMRIPAKAQNTGGWSVWECAPSEFDWHYADTETAYLYEGKVTVTTSSQKVVIQAGDCVTFPKGLSCRWKIMEGVRKVYRFG